LMNTLPEADRNKEQLSNILRDRGLSFLYTLLRIESELVRLMATPDLTAKTLYNWIKDNVDTQLQKSTGFVNVLFAAVSRHVLDKTKLASSEASFNNENSSPSGAGSIAEIEKEHLKKFAGVLGAFLNDKPALQLTALYSLQNICNELGFPKGLILRWFIALYDLEIIEEEVFLKWKEDINDEFPGKGQALFQVNTWLTWLAETEETDEDEDEAEEEVPK